MSRTRKVIFWCAVAVMVISGSFVAVKAGRLAYNAQAYKELQEKATTPEVPPSSSASAAEPPAGPAEDTEKEPYVSPINFEWLQGVNKDIYAWIEIPGMTISYPIVQHPTDDAYYLHYTITGEQGLPASIYTEPSVTSKDFTDFNTIIYGHHAGGGLMFSNLVNYRDQSVLEENREIIIYTPEREYHYKIFAAELFSNEYLPYFYPCDTAEGRQAYLDALADVRDINSCYLDDVEVTPESRIITLSTCTGNPSNRVTNRYLVAAVLEDELPAAEET